MAKRQATLRHKGLNLNVFEANLRKRLRTQGRKWLQKHDNFRLEQGFRNWLPLTGGQDVGWTSYMAPRQKDVLELVAARLTKKMGLGAVHLSSTGYLSEISRGLMYASHFVDSTPCITPSSCVWVYSRWRWLIGVERLALQGFPDGLNFDGLSENEISRLAGNAMSVPVVDAFLMLLVALVDFPDS